MPKNIILSDNFFPYKISSFQCPGISFSKVNIPHFIPKFLDKFYQSLILYKKSFNSGVILTSRRITVLVGLLFLIYKPKKARLIIYEFILNLQNNFRSKVVLFCWRLIIKKVDKVIVQTSAERKFLAQKLNSSTTKFKTIYFSTENKDYIGPVKDGYIFSAGKMERDFITLIEAVKGTNIKTIIVAAESMRSELENKSDQNIEIFFNIPKPEYEALLMESKLVVVPLKKGMASRGQCVVLEGMRYGKPIICSRINGVIEYVKDGYNGFLVEPENPAELRRKILSSFYNYNLLEKLGQSAFVTQRTNYYIEKFCTHYIETFLEMHKEICENASSSCIACQNNLCSYSNITSKDLLVPEPGRF